MTVPVVYHIMLRDQLPAETSCPMKSGYLTEFIVTRTQVARGLTIGVALSRGSYPCRILWYHHFNGILEKEILQMAILIGIKKTVQLIASSSTATVEWDESSPQ